MKRRVVVLLISLCVMNLFSACGSEHSYDSQREETVIESNEKVSGNSEAAVDENNSGEENIDIGMLKKEGFQFYDLSWNSGLREAESYLGALSKDTDKMHDDDTEIYVYPDKMPLLGKDAEISLEYVNKRLTAVVFDIMHETKEETESYTTELLSEVKQLYGESSGSMEVDENLNITYWQENVKDNITSLQIAEDREKLCTVVTLLCEPQNEKVETTISFKDFKDGDYYRYAQIPWNTTKADFDKMLGGDTMELYQEFETVKIYRMSDSVKLLETGEEVIIELEFKDDKLQMMNLIMEEPDETARNEKYAKVKEELRKLYGEEDSEDSMEGMDRIKWLSEKDGDKTTVQVGNDERGIVRIVLAIIQ